MHFISKTEIQELEPFLDARWKNVMAVPGTRQMHCFIASGTDTVKVATTSDSTTFTTVRIRKSNDSGEGDESDEEGDESDEEELEVMRREMKVMRRVMRREMKVMRKSWKMRTRQSHKMTLLWKSRSQI